MILFHVVCYKGGAKMSGRCDMTKFCPCLTVALLHGKPLDYCMKSRRSYMWDVKCPDLGLSTKRMLTWSSVEVHEKESPLQREVSAKVGVP